MLTGTVGALVDARGGGLFPSGWGVWRPEALGCVALAGKQR